MSAERKAFRREGEDRRRADLVAATVDAIAVGGVESATVREIALRAGVTPGLIRHYFPGKDDLLRTAYAETMAEMTEAARAALAGAVGDSRQRLLAFVVANLAPPVASGRALSVWAGFIAKVHADAAFARIHREAYLDFRGEIESLLLGVFAESGRMPGEGAAVRLATAINAVIDGLWLEASLAPDLFAAGELAAAGRMAVEAMLSCALAGSPEQA
ncbi:MAG: TetR family transcriptional regulator C-terminal domain-containing protein [Phyllobacteriaceae bacterium]|nr:TetR family transcriptional regulator C-terminal domain-containing protein [Phyllobacteriaceae bacterium]